MHNTQLYSTGEVARLLGIKKHVLEYLYTSQKLTEPPRFLNHRVFQQSDIRAIAAYLGKGDEQERSDDGREFSSSVV